MTMNSHPVIDGLRLALGKSRGAFVDELESRIRQLIGNMVDGRVLPKDQADELRASVVQLVRSEALPKLADSHPNEALRILDKLKAYGFTQLEGERPHLEAIRASKFPPPPPAVWEEIDRLRHAARDVPGACTVQAPVGNVYFAKQLQDDGLPLPDELIQLYAVCDGFDLSCRASPHIPVFSLLPSISIDTMDESDGFPRRAAVFQGGDEVQLSVYRDRKKQWWLVHEYEYEPVAKRALDLRNLLSFGLRRMEAADDEALNGELSWERYFQVND